MSAFNPATGNAGAIASIETSPGVYQLLIGDSRSSRPVYARDSSYATFSDNGSAYEAGFVVGSIVLANPGELAELGFVTCDFMRVGTSPDVSVLMDEIAGSFSDLSGYIVSEPPLLYGISGAPTSLYSNRYYFKQTVAGSQPPPAWCRHLQIKVDFGATDTVMNEILSSTLWGTILVEGS